MLTVETVLRRIERECRKNEEAFGPSYQPRWRVEKGALMQGAMAEARGVVQICQDFRKYCRKWRREHRRTTKPTFAKGAKRNDKAKHLVWPSDAL